MTAPTMVSIIERLIRVTHIKALCVIGLFVPLIPLILDYHYLSPTVVLFKTTCSSRYPDHSRLLDMPITLPDGSLQAGGWVYPPDAVWWDSGIVHGCPCRVGPCIRPCCRIGLHFNVHRKVNGQLGIACGYPAERHHKNHSVKVSSDLDPTDKYIVPGRHYAILKANCARGELLVLPSATLTVSAKIWYNDKLYDATNDYCLNVWEDEVIWNTVFGCLNHFDENTLRSKLRISAHSTIVEAVVAILLLVTLILYITIPALRPANYGNSLMSYNFAIIVWKFFEIIDKWGTFYYWEFHVYIQVVTRSWKLPVLLWQSVLVYQMWKVFKPGRLRTPNRDEENTKFIYYSLVIWGSYVAIVLWKLLLPGAAAALANDLLMFGLFYVFPILGGDEQYLDYVILFVTLILDISTLLRIRTCQKNSKMTQGPDSKRHNVKEYRWSSMFLKFTLVTSLDFTVLIFITNFYVLVHGDDFVGSPYRYVHAVVVYIVNLKGIEIFFINVWSKKTWIVLKTKYLSKRN